MEGSLTRREVLKKAGFAAAAGLGLYSIFPLHKIEAAVNADETFVNVKDFGAKGAGFREQNDTPMFQNALNKLYASGGGVLYIPPGNYYLHQSLYVRSNVKIIGDETKRPTLHHGMTNQVLMLVNSAENVIIGSINFIGIGSFQGETALPKETAILIKESKEILIQSCSFMLHPTVVEVEKGESVSIVQCDFRNTVGDKDNKEGISIFARKSKNIKVEANRFLKGYRDFVQLADGTTDSVVSANEFSTDANTGVSIVGPGVSSRNVIYNNIIRESSTSGSTAAPKVTLQAGARQNEVMANRIQSATGTGIHIEGAQANRVVSNWVNQTKAAIVCRNSSRNVISGNTIEYSKEYGVLIDATGETGSSSNNVVLSNVISESGKSGIMITNKRCRNNIVHANAGVGNKAGIDDSGENTSNGEIY